jgi:hypothetical protein
MNNTALAATVIRILKHQNISKIAFQVNGLLINAAGFAEVVKAIEDGRIECKSVAEFEQQGGTAPGTIVEARYSISGNAILFPEASYGATASEECTIVHEAVHALFDLRVTGKKANQNLAIDDESAAVLAEAFYVILCRSTGGKMIPVNYRMMVESPQDEGWKVANDIVANGKPMSQTSPYILNAMEIQALRNSVATTYKFNQYVDENNHWSDDSGQKYVYDGVPKCARPTKR